MTSGAGRGAAPARTRTTAVGQRRREAHALDDCDGWRERGLQRGEARAHQPPGRPVCESGRSPGQGGRRLNDCHRFKMRRFELRTLLNAGRRPSRTLRDSSVSHVVAGATMAIVRVSFLREASQVEPCAGSSFWAFLLTVKRDTQKERTVFCLFPSCELKQIGRAVGRLSGEKRRFMKLSHIELKTL